MASLVLGSVLMIATPAAAQVEIEARPEPLDPDVQVVPPPLHYETTRPPDADFYQGGSLVEHDPAFVAPLAWRYETPTGSGQFGLSGWTAPNTPVGPVRSVFREVTGYLAFGFSVTWDGPAMPARGSAP
jgi:hypothetical protein